MATITPVQRRDGVVYKARIRKPGQPAISRTFRYKSDAEKWARKTEGEFERDESGLSAEGQRHTVADAIDRYQRERLPELAAGTRIAYQAHQAYWRDKLGHLRLTQLHPAAIAKARDELLTAKGITKASANRYLAALGAVLTRAAKHWYWIPGNPVALVAKQEEPAGRTRFLNGAELQRLLEACTASASRDLLPLVMIAVTSGARLGEILALRWNTVDLEQDVFRFRVGQVNATKGDVRTVPIVPAVKRLLLARRAQRKVVALKDDGLVFPSRLSPRRPINVRDSWRVAVVNAGLGDFHFHDLRHSHASFLARSGASLLEIGKTLGHKSPSTTHRYAHLVADHTHAMVTDMVNKLLGEEGASK